MAPDPKVRGHFETVGQGLPILCLAGFGSSNWIFKDLATRLQNQFCFILPDNRGMGFSAPAAQPYGLDDLAADALDLMDDLGHERFGVIGLSMGGFIAQLLTLKAPARVSALSLLCTTSGGPAFKAVFPSLSEDQVRAIYSMESHARIAAALSPAICPLLKTKYPEIYAMVVEKRSREIENPAQVMLQYFAVSQFMERLLPLETITCPTQIMTADSDLLVPSVNAEMLAKRIPAASLETVSETDHLFLLEKGDEVSRRIGQFFSTKG